MPENHFDYDVFLSYNETQRDWTTKLARRLRKDGFRVWFDQWVSGSDVGTNWVRSIENGIDRSRKIVLIWSPQYFTHTWPQFESNVIQQLDAIGQTQRVIPLLHSACEIPKGWGFRQALDFANCVPGDPGNDDFEFRYHQLIHNIDNNRPYEGDKEVFLAQLHSSDPAERGPSKVKEQPSSVSRPLTVSKTDQPIPISAGYSKRTFNIAVIIAFIAGLVAGASGMIAYTRGMIAHDKTPDMKKPSGRDQIQELHRDLLSLRKEYKNMSSENKADVNMHAHQLVSAILDVNDPDLDKDYQILKYQHVCYVWGAVAGSAPDNNAKLQAVKELLEACNRGKSVISWLKKTTEWVRTDEAEARIDRLTAVGLCIQEQIVPDPEVLKQVRTLIKGLPQAYVERERPQDSAELRPCLQETQ